MPTYAPLRGSVRSLLRNSRPAGPVDRSEPASLTVRVRSITDPEKLKNRALEESAKPLAQRNYLSRAELAAAFGADPGDLQLVEEYAQKHDLRVVHRSAAERSVVLLGSLGNLLNAFPAQVQMFHHASGTYRGRLGTIQVPQELNGVITGIFGFDTRPKRRSLHRAKFMGMNGPGGDNGVPASNFAERYRFPAEFNGTNLDGSGQTIAIIELGGGFRPSDLSAYFQEIGTPMPGVSFISVDHAGNAPSTVDSDDGEVMLDIEVAGSVAPAAKIAVYFAPNDGNKGFLDAISAAVHDSERNPSVISISWGGPESSLDDQSKSAFEEVFSVAANLGITICTASGDHGTADLDAHSWDGAINVDHPSCSPLVTACGGTQIDAQGEDVVWNDGTKFDVNTPDGGGWTSGGGISLQIRRAGLPEKRQTARLHRQRPKRPRRTRHRHERYQLLRASGFLRRSFRRHKRSSASHGGPGGPAQSGKAEKRGFLNPFLYANAGKVMHDVSKGSNAIKDTAQGYNADLGWDACTGLGTPDGTAILNNL